MSKITLNKSIQISSDGIVLVVFNENTAIDINKIMVECGHATQPPMVVKEKKPTRPKETKRG